MARKTIKLPEEEYERHNERRQELGLTWAEYIDGQSPELEETLREVIREELDNASGSETAMSDDTPAIDVRGTETAEYPSQTGNYERLVLERDGERVTVPIGNFDHHDLPDITDFDRVYVHDGRLVAETEREDGSVWVVEEAGRTSDGELRFEGHITDDPMRDVEGTVLWTRDASE